MNKIQDRIQLSRRSIRPYGTGILLIALSLLVLAGVTTMTYGYYHNDLHFITLGVAVTVAASWTMIMRTLSQKRIEKY